MAASFFSHIQMADMNIFIIFLTEQQGIDHKCLLSCMRMTKQSLEVCIRETSYSPKVCMRDTTQPLKVCIQETTQPLVV